MRSFISVICSSLLVILQISTAYSVSLSSPTEPDLIQQVCKQTKHYNLCVLSLKSDPRSSKADLNGLAAISLDIASKKATDTFNYLVEIYKRINDPTDYKRYGTCIEEYTAAVKRHLPEASKELSSRAYAAAIGDLEAAAKNPMNCEGQFVKKSLLADRNQAVHNLALMAAEIIRVLGNIR